MTHQEDIAAILREAGPLTGAQLQERTRLEVLKLWALCRRASAIRFERLDRRFLRLDRTVEGYARLSPSIRREFQTYTVLGLDHHVEQLRGLAERLQHKIRDISRRKLDLARESMESVLAGLGHGAAIAERACFIIAGDITYDMAHDVPRPEQSTGEMVRGSDLDVIVVTEDDLPAASVKELDNAIFKKKHFLLVHPDYREEIDYIIKGMARVREQIVFDTFEHMVACKIMHEGHFLCGSPRVFRGVKDLIEEHEIPRRLAALEDRAQKQRDQAEQTLLNMPADTAAADVLNLFYTQEESEEIY